MLRSIQLFAVKNQKIIKYLCNLGYYLVLALYGWGFYAYSQDPSVFFTLASIGKTLGVVAIYLYILSLLPGMLKRFGWRPLLPIQATLMLFRRQFGVLMFLLVIVHSGFTTTIPYIVSNDFSMAVLTSHQIIGMIALYLLLPLWVTSNDFSQRKLGRWWKRIHALTYLALVAIFLHVALVAGFHGFVLGLVLGLEVLSAAVAIRRKRMQRAQQPLA